MIGDFVQLFYILMIREENILFWFISLFLRQGPLHIVQACLKLTKKPFSDLKLLPPVWDGRH